MTPSCWLEIEEKIVPSLNFFSFFGTKDLDNLNKTTLLKVKNWINKRNITSGIVQVCKLLADLCVTTCSEYLILIIEFHFWIPEIRDNFGTEPLLHQYFAFKNSFIYVLPTQTLLKMKVGLLLFFIIFYELAISEYSWKKKYTRHFKSGRDC